MANCSKCGIVVVPGDYIESGDKPVCLACALKQGKLSKKHITGWLERFSKQLPMGLKIIVYLVFTVGLFSLSFLRVPTLFTELFGLLLFVAFFSLGFGLVFLLNRARLILIGLTILSVLLDLYALTTSLVASLPMIIRIVLSIVIIVYLVKPSVKKSFV